jgi:hypothetical protein
MLTVAPPRRPYKLSKTDQRPIRYYTIHTHPNDAFTLKVSEKSRISIVGFKEKSDAIFLSQMIETHYTRYKEWPDTRSEGLMLPNSNPEQQLDHVFIKEWDFESLKFECTKNILDMVSVNGIITRKNGNFSLTGDVYKFEAPADLYRMRFEELLTF